MKTMSDQIEKFGCARSEGIRQERGARSNRLQSRQSDPNAKASPRTSKFLNWSKLAQAARQHDRHLAAAFHAASRAAWLTAASKRAGNFIRNRFAKRR
jgi:hypothetical protein